VKGITRRNLGLTNIGYLCETAHNRRKGYARLGITVLDKLSESEYTDDRMRLRDEPRRGDAKRVRQWVQNTGHCWACGREYDGGGCCSALCWKLYRAHWKSTERFAPHQLRLMVIRRDHGCCRYCGRKVDNKGNIDHVIPYRDGGPTEAWNLVLACRSCNRAKLCQSLDLLIPIAGDTPWRTKADPSERTAFWHRDASSRNNGGQHRRRRWKGWRTDVEKLSGPVIVRPATGEELQRLR